ncbi:MAG TPA: TonB-dependent receptor [Candidatus Latescibacteria bacterium]|jgi:hypothetical protein|nr:TonB-dependent receptor [Candidatus Latescibacterota bacterium]
MKDRSLLSLLVLVIGIGVATLGLPESAQAGTTGKIRGTIQDAGTGEPLVGAIIRIEGLNVGTTTDDEGDYFVINLPPGEYAVSVSIIGYEAVTKTGVSVNVDRTVTVDFDLKTAAIEMDVVTVEAESEVVRMDVSGSQAVVTSQDMARTMARNVTESLSLEPQVYNGQVRGGSADETLFMLDGQRLVDERLGEAYMGINATAVKEVQINTGGFNAEYGNVRSGLFNVVTREGKPGEINMFLNYRFAPAQKKHFGADAFGAETWEWRVHGDSDRLRRVWSEGDQLLFEGAANSAGNIPLYGESGNVVRTVAPDAVPSEQVWKGWMDVGEGDAAAAKEAQNLWMWRHRGQDYADAPDMNLDATVIGTIPGMDDLKFLVSHRFEDNQYGLPHPREGYGDRNSQVKLDYVGLENWKITTNYLTGHIESLGSMSRDWAEGISQSYNDLRIMRDLRPSYLNGADVSANPSGSWNGETATFSSITAPRSKYNVVGSEVDRNFSQVGLTIKNVRSASTFWDMSLQRFSAEYDMGPSALRDLTVQQRTVAGGTVASDATPVGWVRTKAEGDQQPDQPGYYLMGSDAIGRDSSSVVTSVVAANITSQINKYHQVKAGVELVIDDVEEFSGIIRLGGGEPFGQWKKYDFSPRRVAAYLQDKLEIEGMIANFGMRLEYMDPNVARFFPDAEEGGFFGEYARMPAWFLEGGRGAEGKQSFSEIFDGYLSSGVDGAGEAVDANGLTSEDAKTRMKLSPRLGVSFPVSDVAKVYFNYGHFYTMPRTRHLYGFMGGSGSQFFNWMGNPDLDWAKTVAYEVGYDHNIADSYRLHLAGYVKDDSNLIEFTRYWPTALGGSEAIRISQNKFYRDTRGFEAKLEKMGGRYVTGWVNYGYLLQKSGLVGFLNVYQDPREVNVRSTTEQRAPDPIPSLRASIDLHVPAGFGPELAGIRPLDGLSANWLQWWARGQKVTFDPVGSGVVDNYRNRDAFNADLRISKAFDAFGAKPVFFVDIHNVFNRRQLNPAGFTPEEWRAYMNSLRPESKGGQDRIGDWDKSYIELPERDRWAAFIDPRQVFIGLNFNLDVHLR